MDDIQIIDTITVDQIETGDQIILDGELLEDVTAMDSTDDPDEIIVTGYSQDTGDAVRYEVPFNYVVQVWSV